MISMIPELSDNQSNEGAARSHIRSIEHGLTEHSRCLKGWHRSLLCGLPISDVYLLKDGYLKCGFGKWYRDQTSTYFVNDEDFLLVKKAHQEMHDIARVLALKSKLEDTITKEDYDVLSEKEQELTTLLLKLKDKLHENMSKIDFLTGVPTRQPFFQTLSMEHARALRKGEPCVIALIDLDNLKDVNDTYGHLSGDKVLKNAAQYLIHNLRKYDSICRYGGDEFLICIPQTTPDTAREIITRLQTGLSSLPITLDEGIVVNITASAGATLMATEHSIDEIIARADEALYNAKRQGKNQISFFENRS
ncbi:MAG: diguanylate cyclase [Thermodesulfobacteriota bacterium]